MTNKTRNNVKHFKAPAFFEQFESQSCDLTNSIELKFILNRKFYNFNDLLFQFIAERCVYFILFFIIGKCWIKLWNV